MKEQKMNKILAGILAVSMTAGIVSAQAQTNVLSRNAVGYVKVGLEGGQLALLRNDFNTLTGAPATPSSVYGDSLPVGSQIFLFNTITLGYDISTFEEGLDPVTFLPVQRWSDDSMDLSPGNSWWVRPSGSGLIDIITMGEVPANSQQSVVVVPGLAMVGFPFPATTDWIDTELAKSAQLGDQVFIYDPVTENYIISTYEEGLDPITFLPVQQWSDATISIQPGVGFWYRAVAGRSVDENRPYTWPNDN
jgi:hypothetical protein